MSSPKVIVFGPTGNVARFVATTAQENGAKVYLAMRDPSKAISGLSAEEEKAGGYERVQADTTKPDTVRDAVSKTEAKRAFFYVAHGAQDGMKATIEAMKSAGIEFVVVLSSYTILRNDPKDIPPNDFIPFFHAQVEISLTEVFGNDNYVALRPGGFATNMQMWYGEGIKKGSVKMYQPDAGFDCITNDDMGRVGGVILAKGPKDGQRIVFLFGPDFVKQKENIEIISQALGKKIDVEWTDEEGAKASFQASGTPEPLAAYLASKVGDIGPTGFEAGTPGLHAEGVANIEKYTGRKALDYKTWVDQNKEIFQ